MRERPPAVARLPRSPGVYRFRDARGRVLYVGRASVLRSRVSSYWPDLRDREHLAAMVARVARVEAVTCDSVHEAAWLERNLLEASLPPWNRTPGGQEPRSTLDAANLTISGWADGMLVQFRIRDWSQRSCGHPHAAGALAATPAAWRDFTQRNAELAATLTRE